MMVSIMVKGRIILFFIWSLSCFSLLSVTPLWGETKETREENEVLVMGTGAIIKGNIAMAREQAISRALVKGVENHLFNRLGSQSAVNYFHRLVQDVIPGAKEDIENFHILAEDRIGTSYKVLVRVRINEKVMDERLRQAGLLLMEGPPVKVLFLVSETRRGAMSYWWRDPELHVSLTPSELVVHNVFQKWGFSPINRVSGLPEMEFSHDLRSADLQDSDVLMWGEIFSADVVIYGQTEIIDQREVSLALKAFDVMRSMEICQGLQVGEVENGIEGNEPIIDTISRLVNSLASRLTPSILRIIVYDNERINHHAVTLTGLSTYKQFRQFRDFLRNEVKGVKAVSQTRVRNNSISIEIEFRGDRKNLLDSILNNANLPFLLKVSRGEGGETLLSVAEGNE